MEGLAFYFVLSEMPATATFRNGEQVTLSFEAADSLLSASVYYDYSENPLTLKADVSAGDSVSLTLFPHRIELAVNGTIRDEEWPTGDLLFSETDELASDLSVRIERKDFPPVEQPSVLGTS